MLSLITSLCPDYQHQLTKDADYTVWFNASNIYTCGSLTGMDSSVADANGSILLRVACLEPWMGSGGAGSGPAACGAVDGSSVVSASGWLSTCWPTAPCLLLLDDAIVPDAVEELDLEAAAAMRCCVRASSWMRSSTAC